MQFLAFGLAGVAAAMHGLTPALPQHIAVKLIAESTAPRPGQTVLVGLQMTPRPGWHDYWTNPGEAGLAPVVNWAAPDSLRFGPLQHPAPTLLKVQGLTSYVHAGPHLLISRMTLAGDLRPATVLPIKANVSWAACSDRLCVPEHAILSLRMAVGNGEPSADAVTLRRAVAAEPKAIGAGTFEMKHDTLILELPGNAAIDAHRAVFFPDQNGILEAAGARITSARPLRIEAPVKGAVPPLISGVVSDGSAAFRISFRRRKLLSAETHGYRQSPAVSLRRRRKLDRQSRETPSNPPAHAGSVPTVPHRPIYAALAALRHSAVGPYWEPQEQDTGLKNNPIFLN